MTAAAPGLDLFPGLHMMDHEPGKDCSFQVPGHGKCPAQATHLGTFLHACGPCKHTESPYCLHHADAIKEWTRDPMVILVCPKCHFGVELVAMEPLR